MGDQQGGPAGHDRAQGLVDLVLDAGVHGGGGVVEEQQPRVGEDRPGQGDALALAAGEGQALLADLGVVPGGQGPHEPVGLGGAGGGLDLLVGGARVPVGDVGADGVGEEEGVLGDEADRAAQGRVGQLADVVSADAHGAAVGVVEARHQQRDGGLPAAGGADDGDGLALRHGEREPVEDGPLGVVAEVDVLELDGGGRVGGQFTAALRDRGFGVDELEDALHTGAGLLGDGEDHGEHADGADELREVGGEGDEGAERDLSLGGHPAAEGQHGDLGERGHGLEGGGVAGVEPDGPQPSGEEPAPGLAELAGLLLLLPEALDDAYAGHGPVDDARDGGGLALRVPGGGEELLAAALGDEPERGGHQQRDDGQQRRQPQHDPEGYPEEQEVPDRHREHEEQALDELEVGGGASDDLPGGQLVLAPPVEPGDGVVHVGAQVVLHVEGEASAVVPAYVGEGVHEQGGGYEHPRPGAHGLGPVPDDVVDDHLGDQGHERHDGHARQRGAEREQHVGLVPPGVGGQPLSPALFLPRRCLCRRHVGLPVRSCPAGSGNAPTGGFHPAATIRTCTPVASGAPGEPRRVRRPGRTPLRAPFGRPAPPGCRLRNRRTDWAHAGAARPAAARTAGGGPGGPTEPVEGVPGEGRVHRGARDHRPRTPLLLRYHLHPGVLRHVRRADGRPPALRRGVSGAQPERDLLPALVAAVLRAGRAAGAGVCGAAAGPAGAAGAS